MASTAKIQERIADIVGRPYNVRFEEIKWVMDQLGASERSTKHTRMFTLPGHRFTVNEHSNGKSTVPKYSVDNFRNLMIELGLYD